MAPAPALQSNALRMGLGHRNTSVCSCLLSLRRLYVADQRAMDRSTWLARADASRFDLVFEERPGVDGVFGSSDSTAALAVVVADRLGLPGPGYDGVHALPRQARVAADPGRSRARGDARVRRGRCHAPDRRPPLPYPFFLKPVQGHLSQHAYRIGFRPALSEALAPHRRGQLQVPDRRGAP